MTTAEHDLGSGRPPVPEGFERRRKRGPVLLLGVIVLGSFFALGYTMFTRSVVYYETPTEALANPGKEIRISGSVVDGSIVKDVESGIVSFDVSDGTTTMTVSYEGPAPDTLKDEAEAVAEGRLGPDGVFRADKLFAKCPSKFSPKNGQ